MGRRNPERAERRHGERLAAVESDMGKGSFCTALESIRWILGDTTLPPATRLSVTLMKVRVLLETARPCEASVSLYAAVNLMNQHGLYEQCQTIKELTALVENDVKLMQNVGSAGC